MLIEPLANWGTANQILTGAVCGSIVGSFLATLVGRWPEGRSIVFGRSCCDACSSPLTALELVPMASFLALRGRCRKCHTHIHWRHPAFELAAALIGALALTLQPGWPGVAGALFGWILLTLGALDLEHLWLPDRLTLPLLLAGLGIGAAGLPPPLTDRLIGAGVAYLSLAVIAAGYRKLRGRVGLGGGDPKLFAAIGAWLGWRALPLVLLVASIGGLLVVLILHLAGRRIDTDKVLPFGTYLTLAAWVGWLANARQWTW